MAMATKTHSDDYPTITAWSGTAGESHPWRRLLLTPIDPEVSRPTVADMSLRPLEVMALIVQNSRPAGLGSFLD